MAVNLASKYSPIVDERFSITTVTNIAFNTDYDWVGVRSVFVYSIPTVPMNNYMRSGLSRYGTPEELQDSVQELPLTQDRSFTYTIDLGNQVDQMYVKAAGESLARQLREIVVPEVDTYRIGVLAANASGTDDTPATADNAYELFLSGQEFMGNHKVPMPGRIAYTTFNYYNLIKLDPSFTQSGNQAQISLVNGEYGRIDGVPVIPVPSSYLPADTQFLLVHPIAGIAPVKLAEMHIHDNPPGVSGWLVEGRFYYDAFVLSQKEDAIYLSTSA